MKGSPYNLYRRENTPSDSTETKGADTIDRLEQQEVLVMLGLFFLGRIPKACEQDYLEAYKDRRGIRLLFTS